jgi:hypothetical protein
MGEKRFDILRRSDGGLVVQVEASSVLGRELVERSRHGLALLGGGLVAWDRVTGEAIYRG